MSVTTMGCDNNGATVCTSSQSHRYNADDRQYCNGGTVMLVC